MKIDVLYFQGCPNHEPTVQRVREVINRLGVTADVREFALTQDNDPVAMKFIGSPTVLIDGQDMDPAQRGQASYGFGCRMFGGAGVPPVEMIGALVTSNEDDVKHCAMSILYSLSHLGGTISPQAERDWIGEAGPGDDGGGPRQ